MVGWMPAIAGQQAFCLSCLQERRFVMFDRVKAFLRDEDGATSTEYAVMLALIIVIALGAISALGSKVSDTFADIESAMP